MESFRSARDNITSDNSISTCGDVYQKWADCKDANTEGQCITAFNQTNPPTCICTQSLNIEQNMDKSVSESPKRLKKISNCLEQISDFYLLPPH